LRRAFACGDAGTAGMFFKNFLTNFEIVSCSRPARVEKTLFRENKNRMTFLT
jgi:hypothetical protein